MTKEFVPFALDEDKFPLGRGLRGLAGRYQAMFSAGYITDILLERIDNVQSLDEEVREEELNYVCYIATVTEIGAWKSPSTSILPANVEIAPNQEDLSTKLTQALRNAKDDYETLASKAYHLWNMFFRLGSASDKFRESYEEANKALYSAISDRNRGKREEYEQELAKLDEIIEKIRSSIE